MDVNVKSIFLSMKLRHRPPAEALAQLRREHRLRRQLRRPRFDACVHGVEGRGAAAEQVDRARLRRRRRALQLRVPGITGHADVSRAHGQGSDPEAAIAARLRRVPMGVSLTPHDIAKSVLYFSCEDSAASRARR
jgi:hypothetical protein